MKWKNLAIGMNGEIFELAKKCELLEARLSMISNQLKFGINPIPTTLSEIYSLASNIILSLNSICMKNALDDKSKLAVQKSFMSWKKILAESYLDLCKALNRPTLMIFLGRVSELLGIVETALKTMKANLVRQMEEGLAEKINQLISAYEVPKDVAQMFRKQTFKIGGEDEG